VRNVPGRIFGGTDPVTGKQVMLTGSADSEAAAVEVRDRFRQQVRDRTAVRTNVTLGADVVLRRVARAASGNPPPRRRAGSDRALG